MYYYDVTVVRIAVVVWHFRTSTIIKSLLLCVCAIYSQKLDVPVDKDVVYNFTCSFECSEVAHTLDDVAHKPVILTVFEILPKEKKQKEEKTTVLGQAVVDLLPLLRGQCSFSSTVLLHAVPGSPADVASTLDVTVHVPEPLLSDAQRSDSNVLMVTVETAYSVPDVWNPASTPPSHYIAALQMPVSATVRDKFLLFSNGVLKMGGEKDCYERTLDSVLDASDTHSIYLRLGSIYLQKGEYEKARPVFLRACKRSPSCLTWLRLGIACYRVSPIDFHIMDKIYYGSQWETKRFFTHWINRSIMLTLVALSFQTGRKLEAEQSYKYALKMNLQEESLLEEIHELQSRVGFGNPSF
uniref:Uncharacterized protein n=1 Tax=Sinocyclocheilus grahami TaxID=75366 RepID=A0A672NPY7_SINGR